MILTIHIIIALSSVLFSAAAAFRPSKSSLYISYALAGGTLGSGILLVVTEPKTMVQACISGLIYFAIIAFILAITQQKLLRQSKVN